MSIWLAIAAIFAYALWLLISGEKARREWKREDEVGVKRPRTDWDWERRRRGMK